MRGWRELLGVVMAGLTSRKIRTLLIVLGPLLGVSSIVAAVGLTNSSKGALKARLAELGTTLVVAEAGGSFGAVQDPRFPEDVNERVMALETVEGVSGITQMSGMAVRPHSAAEDEFRTVPIPVIVVEPGLLEVINVPMKYGRWVNEWDTSRNIRSVVVGQGLADRFEMLPPDPDRDAIELRTILVNDLPFAVVGVLDRFAFDPDTFDNAVFLPQGTAEEEFENAPEPSILYVRTVDGETQRTVDGLANAISLGGDYETAVDVPSDLLEADAETDKTLRNIVVMMGALALVVGGVGIANVMSISVIQRSSEIGIRRALGHSRSRIGFQFMLEAMAVGFIGGVAGVLIGAGVIYAVSDVQGWIPVVDWGSSFLWVFLAMAVAVLFGLYPSIRAARLEPLETLRLG